MAEHFNGEENETEVIVETCCMYRFDKESKVWKEKGHGALKILKHNSKLQYRIVMRRDQVLTLCANHLMTTDMTFTPISNSNKSFCYWALDYSEEEGKVEFLAIKFNKKEKSE
ncbi:unnamed protein product, partial [Lymnaea stagnalis]